MTSSMPNLPNAKLNFRALVIEDQGFQRDVMVQALQLCGAKHVDQAVDGASAIGKIDQANEADVAYDVLLCDLKMPGMDGLEFLRRLAERSCHASVILASCLDPAIIRSAEIMGRTYGVRLLGAVEKPVTPDKLTPLLLRHLRQRLGLSKTDPGGRAASVIEDASPLLLTGPAEIRRGLSYSQFEPYFQPKMDVRRGTLVGAEALIRWNHPDYGVISPAEFIGTMEADGSIIEATDLMLERSLEAHRRWQRHGQTVPISINVSVESLTDTQLPDRFSTMVKGVGLDAELITFEVTETMAMTDLGHSLETLARLRMKGFGLSIDDYGTGFSSMQQLSRIPFNELKIDQSFVTQSSAQPVLNALLESSVGIGRRLGLRTVAEGVETRDDWAVVVRSGCDVAQGFFAARPMPADDLLDWYDGWRGIVQEQLTRFDRPGN